MGSTDAGAGESEVVGERNDGLDVNQDPGIGSRAVPRLDLEASVDAGQSARDQQRYRERGQRRLRPRPLPHGHGTATRGGGTGVRDAMRVDLVSLASGAAVVALGALVLLDSSGAVDISLGSIAVVLTGASAHRLLGGLASGGAAVTIEEMSAAAGAPPRFSATRGAGSWRRARRGR